MNFRSGSMSRRAFSASSVAGLAGLAGCSMTNDGVDPTPTPEPTSTPALAPTPTQEAIASPVPGYADSTRWAGRTLTVAAWGGEYQDAQQEAFFQPFETDTGAVVQEKVADLESLRTQVENQEVIWDVLTLPMREMIKFASDGYLEPLNYDIIDRSSLFEDIVRDFGVGAAYFSTILTYPADSDSGPSSWADFWAVEPLPDEGEVDPLQLRSLQRNPIGTFEFALLADGVEPAVLYPLDIDRALQSLEKIRDNILVWWQESKEPVELVAANQVGMASSWNSRITQLELAESLRVLWYQGMLSADAWVIPFGTTNADVAMDFVNYATRAIPSANFARIVPYGPVNAEAFGYLRQDRLPLLPSSPTNKAVQFVEDWDYWANYQDSLTAKFEEWLLVEKPGTPEPVL